MENYSVLIISLVSFIVFSLASRQIGYYLCRIRLPLISGFLITGVIVGPFGLELISTETVENLRFIDEMALGFIAFAAGSELYLKDLRDRLKSIAWVTAGLVVSTFTLGALVILLLADNIPFMRALPFPGRLGIALLGGSILVARSPSSAIAIVNELGAKGPFTRTIALALFAVRLVGIFIGSFSGGLIAGDPLRHNRLSWMAYVTQAGVGLGLAKEVAGEFPA